MWYAETVCIAILHVDNSLTLNQFQKNPQYIPSNSSLGDDSFGGGLFEDVHLLAVSVAVMVLAMVVVILKYDSSDL